MRHLSITPSITVTIGRHTRIYYAFVTAAPVELDSPATVTLHASTFSDVVGFAADPVLVGLNTLQHWLWQHLQAPVSTQASARTALAARRQLLATVASFFGGSTIVVKIVPNEKQNPPGKLADAELHFTDGALEGLKLIGFFIWERHTGGGRNVTFPARQYAVNGERRSFALLRPIADASAQDRIRDLGLQAYAEYEETPTEAAS